MTEAQMQFKETYKDSLAAFEPAYLGIWNAAWQHQQQRIEELEEQLKDRKGDLKYEYNRAEELERVNKQIRSAFQAYYEAVKQRALSYDVEIKLIKALKQIEATS